MKYLLSISINTVNLLCSWSKAFKFQRVIVRGILLIVNSGQTSELHICKENSKNFKGKRYSCFSALRWHDFSMLSFYLKAGLYVLCSVLIVALVFSLTTEARSAWMFF